MSNQQEIAVRQAEMVLSDVGCMASNIHRLCIIAISSDSNDAAALIDSAAALAAQLGWKADRAIQELTSRAGNVGGPELWMMPPAWHNLLKPR